jgi:lipopolysaccharide/colanic/teichoic acid biosynthesis glycosyltransferase
MNDRTRWLDLALGIPALLISLPLQLVAAALVKLSSPGPVLHQAQRVGKDGELFTLRKFRSMRVGAASAGPAVTAGGDPRITPIGRWLRRSKLDELPQLFNVVAGEMSLVGPRPEDPKFVATYTDAQREVLSARPGMTGPASIVYRDEESHLAAAADVEMAYRLIMEEKLQIDIDYLRRRTIGTDIGILVRTVRAVVSSD